MPYTMEEFMCEFTADLLTKLPPEKRLRGLPPEERLAGLTAEQLAELERLLRERAGDDPSRN